MEEKVKFDDLDLSEPEVKAVKKTRAAKSQKSETQETAEDVFSYSDYTEGLVSCLSNEKITVKHINKQTGLVKDPKHVLYGGMAETAKRTYVVPVLKSGSFVNVLTKEEKDFLEQALGLEPNAMSVYRKENNFWSTANSEGISSVVLGKQDTILDLSNPIDYIKYKILLANKDRIAPSVVALQETPKATYEYVLIKEEDETKISRTNMTTKMACYKEFGKYEDNADVLRLIIETVDGRPLAANTKLDFLQAKANDIIQSDSKLFLKLITDKYLKTKVLIKKAIEAGIIAQRGNYLYLRNSNLPLCNNDQEPTFNVAAAYLNEPRHQDVKLSIETKLQ